MVKLSNKQPYIIHDINNSDFRVVEYDGVFQIQRKQIKIKILGILFWKKRNRRS
jgi:hypothetical protein